MKEQGIIFTGDSVPLILADLKWQTRRVINPQPVLDGLYYEYLSRCWLKTGDPLPFIGHLCPYGQPGDRLWVRESWQAWKEFDKVRADALPDAMKARINFPANGNTWDARIRPSIHMPRWASRILLEITDIRVQRIQDITGHDVIAEGVSFPDGNGISAADVMKRWEPFRSLWNRINAHRGYSWDVNPWVWVVSFKVVKP